MALCSASFISWTDPCTRAYFESLLPFIVSIFVTCLALLRSSKILARVTRALKSPFKQFLTLPEAEAFISDHVYNGESPPKNFGHRAALWRTVCLSTLSLGETVAWLIIANYQLALKHGTINYQIIPAFLNALSWLPAVVIPVIHPKVTPSYDLFWLYTFQLVTGIFRFGTLWYDRDTAAFPLQVWDVAGSSINLLVILTLLFIILRMPLNMPSSDAVAGKIGDTVNTEDYTPLWGWITFEWIWPLIRKGDKQVLNESDVWDMSPTMQSKPVYHKFAETKRKSLFRRLWAANSLDIIIDFFLTIVSVVFNYGGPFFLNRILASLELSATDPDARGRAYIYAFLMFLCTVFKAEADVLHLWYGRRASTRIRSELMASVYAKALTRKDYTGIIKNEKTEDSDDDNKAQAAETSAEGSSSKKKQEGKKKKKKEEETKNTAGADIGKIVNLMSGDADSVSMTVGIAYFLYAAPFEIVIASVFLYQLLGLSAFAGFLCLLIASPVNKILAGRSISINRSALAARDKRMGIVNELLNGVKLVKFYGWENKWIDRVLESRNIELRWLVKTRINQVMFSALWSSVPIFVSVVSFFTYIATGHELTIPVAFTSISLFSMLRAPLNVIPTWIVQILQTRNALDRIETFLNEDDVSSQVSSLKQGNVNTSQVDDNRFGILHASFKWNEVEDISTLKGKGPANPPMSSNASAQDLEPGPNDSISASGQSTNEDRKFELRDIDVVFPEGKLTLITGPTASGKTALLLSLLGETTMLPGNGQLLLPKHQLRPDEHGNAGISYAAQSPFLQHQSIRENILFGAPYHEERYEAVLDACALRPDFEIFEEGDLTEIGSRGISLSGGQKARVALARAVYARTKCVLLDDPLSAVDSHTALFLYEKLLKGPLLANRTVVLVTHNVNLVLPGAYYLVRMLDGRIDVQGTADNLREQGILDAISKDAATEAAVLAKDRPVERPDDSEEAMGEVNKDKKDSGAKRPKRLVEEENRETGNVKWNIYKTYMKASSYYTWITLCVAIVLYQLLGVAEKLWIKQWGEAYHSTESTNHLYFASPISDNQGDLVLQHTHVAAHFTTVLKTFRRPVIANLLPAADEHPLFYVGVYAAISFSAALIGVINAITQYAGGLRASRILFKQLLVAVVRATMRWHDSTPTGRMLNRFSEDIETVDASLASSLQAVNSSMATFFASIVTVIFFSPPFVIPAIIIGYVYYKLGVSYLNTGRDLRRMESNSHSPIFSDFSEMLSGIVTVRAFSAEKRFLNSLHGKIDTATKMWYFFWMTNRWLLLHFDFLGGLAVLFTTLFALSGAIGAGLAGVTITSAMGFTSAVYWTCRFWTQLELDLNSVERVVEYLELPQEPPVLIESNRPPAYWPSSSDNDALVDVENLVMRYAPELPPVLHGVSFKLRARERVGLLGRTGSGKSTLAMSLLRFTDPSSGTIRIDGIDITAIGLHDLRSRITFVAQDAVLFSGTIRDNIDPFGDYTDEQCLNVLSRVHLVTESQHVSQASSRRASRTPSVYEQDRDETIVPSTAASSTINPDEKQVVITLDTKVSEGGSNFSQGQRQLLTMARALLRQSSIIILDEATSSIDYATDAKIQKTIREEFTNSLLLTVAHRLRTVIDYDRLIVLDNGRIVEFDTPYNLIRKEGSVFRDMCMHSGHFKELQKAVDKAAESHHS